MSNKSQTGTNTFPSSLAKHQANIANAQLSTGPRTEAGKSKSSMNARRYGLGHHEHAGETGTDSPETEAAITQAQTWRDGHPGFTNITLYEARVRRLIALNEKRLHELQQARQLAEAQAREEAELLLCQSVMNSEDLHDDQPLNVRGFVFTPTNLIAAIKRREALESARFYRLNRWDNSERWHGSFSFPPVTPAAMPKAA